LVLGQILGSGIVSSWLSRIADSLVGRLRGIAGEVGATVRRR
jgi:hypothetical protein